MGVNHEKYDNSLDQAPNTAKSVHTDLHHFVYGTRLALHKKMRLSLEQGGAEIGVYFSYFRLENPES